MEGPAGPPLRCPPLLRVRPLHGKELANAPKLAEQGDVGALVRLADHYFWQGEQTRAKALALYFEALTRDPWNLKAHLGAGMILVAQHKPGPALRHLRAARNRARAGSPERAYIEAVIRRVGRRTGSEP